MSLQNNKVDKLVKETLRGMELNMSGSEELWQNIDPYKKKRRGIPFWIMGIGVISLLILITLSVINKNRNVDTVQRNDLVLEKETQLLSVEKELPQVVNSNVTNDINKENKWALKFSDSITLNKESKKLSNSINATKINNSIRESDNFISLTKDSFEANDSPLVQNIKPKRNNQKNILKPIVEIQKLFSEGLISKYNNTKEAIVHLEQPRNNTEEIKLNKTKRGNFFIRTEILSYLPFDKIKFRTNRISLESQAFEELWGQHFTPLSSSGGSLVGGYKYEFGLGIFAGVEYIRTESQFENNQTISTRILDYYSNAYYANDENGNKSWHGADVYRNQILNVQTLSSVVESEFNIPIGIFYDIFDKGKFGWRAQLALHTRVKRNYSGQYLTESLNLENLNSNSQSHFLSKQIIFSQEIASTFKYALNSKIDIIFNSKIRYTGNQSPTMKLVRQERIAFGISFGLEKCF